MSKITKRFIAGAVCPKCGELDVLLTYRENDDEYRECVDCGFKDKMNFQAQPRELETRVNKTEEEIAAETQVVTILPTMTKPKS